MLKGKLAPAELEIIPKETTSLSRLGGSSESSEHGFKHPSMASNLFISKMHLIPEEQKDKFLRSTVNE